MTAKRALIVDDSRSARVILGRMLEGYGLQVDTAESAEQALEYLREQRPDVIFMDHLMPGMDGFQAVQALKANPHTATIPVMMYTSQEGELYLSQARALGAVGVLPKTVKQTDVSRVLYQLRLLPDRRAADSTHSLPAAQAASGASETEVVPIERSHEPGEIERAVRGAIGPALEEQTTELRRCVTHGLEALGRRMTARLEALAARLPEAPPASASAIPERPARRRWLPLAATVALAWVPALVLGALYVQALSSTSGPASADSRLGALEAQQAQILTLLAELRAELRSPAADSEPAQPAPAGLRTTIEQVPYGEAPLAGARLERLRALLAELPAQDFRGRLRITTYVGDFCLTGNALEGYSIAADDLPVTGCDLLGNPFDDGLTTAERQSLDFANLISTFQREVGDTLAIGVQHLGRQPRVAYPDRARAALTAGEWNRIAAQNNRVEFALEPAS